MKYPEAKSSLILRYHRLMDAFTKSNDERDFYLDRIEGFIIYADLDKSENELSGLYKELQENQDRYCLIPKMTFYEVKKIMEGFVNEKVYDIDTKEKLLDIIGTKEARGNFLDFIYDHLTELEKWQNFYQERSRIRVIEWLRQYNIHFVFEEDIDIPKTIMEKLKRLLFEAKVPKDVQQARDLIEAKSKSYYSNEALNPRPKRGRPPKQTAKVKMEPQLTVDIYTTVPASLRPFLYIPDITNAASVTFSEEFDTEEQLLASLRGTDRVKVDEKLAALSQRLESLQLLSERLTGAKKELGIERFSSSFEPLSRPKLEGKKTFEISKEPKEKKIESAIGGVLQGQKTTKETPEEEGVEFKPQQRRRFAIKKVSKMPTKKKKKK